MKKDNSKKVRADFGEVRKSALFLCGEKVILNAVKQRQSLLIN